METKFEEMGDEGISEEDRSGDRNSEQKLQLYKRRRSGAVMAFITASSNISQLLQTAVVIVIAAFDRRT